MMPSQIYDAARAAERTPGLIAFGRRLRNRVIGQGEAIHLFLMTGGAPARLCFAFAALLTLVLATVLAGTPQREPRAILVGAQRPGQVVLPQGPAPMVEPLELMVLDPETARDINARVPFVTGPIPPAAPYKSELAGEDLARATDCLAVAVLYEAGNDPEGQRAVAQVVLNRVRHPAFPATICGVVFQGSERLTGCQFSFTCDGALSRWQPSPALWTAARGVAIRALAGDVYKLVGLATHYHTDWVVPYWSPTLDKIAQVHTHIFFRWTGWWGTPAAFRGRPEPIEPRIDKLAMISDAHKPAGPAIGGLLSAEALAAAALETSRQPPHPAISVAPSPPVVSDPAIATLPRATEATINAVVQEERKKAERRRDPCTQMRGADTQLSFCANR